MTDSSATIERRSLEIGKWANLFMAISGIAASYASASDAILVDGLYSGVNFLSAIVAGRITLSLARPADRRFPFGYDAYEALYVKYRSLVLLGIMAFAIFGAGSKIITYARGGQVPELVFGPILIYMLLMVGLCLGLAWWHHTNWRKSGGRSELLQTESRAAIVDGVISAGAGAGLLAAALLRGTFLAGLVPISDSIVVLIMCAFIIRQPLAMFRGSLREVAGGAADPETVGKIERRIEELITDRPLKLVDIAVTKLGRSYFVIPYLEPSEAIDAAAVDRLRHELLSIYGDMLGEAKVEIIITAEAPYPEKS